MTDSRTYFDIEATIRLADGSTISHTESHRVGEQEDGSFVIAYSDEFAFAQAEAVAAELGGEVEDVEFGYCTPPSIRWDDLDLY